jgi:hypothetical protein
MPIRHVIRKGRVTHQKFYPTKPKKTTTSTRRKISRR